MPDFRTALRKARRNLHDHMKVPALYIAYTGADPVAVSVRDFTRINDTGDMGKSSDGYAVISNSAPRLIFFRDELENARVGAVFSVADGVAYRVERTSPPNDETRTVEVTPLSASEAQGLPLPDA